MPFKPLHGDLPHRTYRPTKDLDVLYLVAFRWGCAVAGGRLKRLSGVSCLRSDGVLLVHIAADALSTFPASTWGLVLAKAVRSASSWGLVFGFEYGIGCE